MCEEKQLMKACSNVPVYSKGRQERVRVIDGGGRSELTHYKKESSGIFFIKCLLVDLCGWSINKTFPLECGDKKE